MLVEHKSIICIDTQGSYIYKHYFILKHIFLVNRKVVFIIHSPRTPCNNIYIVMITDSMPGCCISELKTRYKGMSEVYRLPVELRVWFASIRITFSFNFKKPLVPKNTCILISQSVTANNLFLLSFGKSAIQISTFL